MKDEFLTLMGLSGRSKSRHPDVCWYSSKRKRPIAYSTKASSDVIEEMIRQGYTTPNKLLSLNVMWGPDEREVLQAYVNIGEGDLPLVTRVKPLPLPIFDNVKIDDKFYFYSDLYKVVNIIRSAKRFLARNIKTGKYIIMDKSLFDKYVDNATVSSYEKTKYPINALFLEYTINTI